jgi:hypothetical protein
MATLSQRLLDHAADVRAKSNPVYFDAIKSVGDRVRAAAAAAAASRADLVANVLPSSPKFGQGLDSISATAETTFADTEQGHAPSFQRTAELAAFMETTVPTGDEAWFPAIVAELKAMPLDERRVYLRSIDVPGAALAALKACPFSALIVPPNVLTDAIRAFNERTQPAKAQELKNLEGYTYAVKMLIEDARRIVRDIVEGRADVPAPTPEPTRSFTRL